MSVLSGSPWSRWLVPVAVAVVAVSGTSLVTRLAASADADLPPRTAAELLVDVQSARLSYGSGTVVQTADLGLPELPAIGGAGSSEFSSLVSGTHTLRVWYDGDSKARLALMGTLGESDVILNGRDLWTWSSSSNSATHRKLDAGLQSAISAPRTLGDLATTSATPQQLASQALAAIDPSTSVTTDGTARVAGRSAYELVLTPRDSASLVGQIRIAVDGAKRVPLRVQIFAKGVEKPSAEVGFTQISFARPDETQFRFAPPPGAKVTQAGDSRMDPGDPPAAAKDARPREDGEPAITGTGWTTVVQAELTPGASSGKTPAESAGDGLSQVLGVLPRVSGDWGSGRLLRSALFSVLVTDDNRLLAGAVAPERLYQMAAQPFPAAAS